MTLLRLAAFVGALSLALGTAATAEPPSCERIVAELTTGATSDRVARSLGVTRARVNACAKIKADQSRHRQRGAELHDQRAQRGLDH